MKYPSIRIEGAILSADILDKIEQGELHGQKPKDFWLEGKSVRVKDEIVKAWADAQDMWSIFKRRMEAVSENKPGTTETRNFWIVPLLGLLGYEVELYKQAQVIQGKTYAISHRTVNLDNFPIHIMGFRDSLDKKRQDSGPRMSPHALVQEYINLHEHLYAVVSNGLTIRLLRDSSRLIKLSFIEFDLERMFEEEHFADFALLYRLLHVSRMPVKQEESTESLIEGFHQDSLDSGSRIRDGLSAAVEYSIKSVANGFLSHPENDNLRKAIDEEGLTANEFYKYQLRFIYRLLFLMVIEERDLIFTSETPKNKKDIYNQYYSVNRIRRLSEKRYLADKKHSDVWINLKNTFRLFESAHYGNKLDISPLSGDLFGYNAIGILNECDLDNKVLLDCLKNLSIFTNPDTGQKMRVNYGSLNVEEFGSVYEGLLEYEPLFDNVSSKPAFRLVKGDERSASGSHYTPDELVQPLIKHSLEYIIEDKLKETDPEKALLSITVCDVACGSGHILLAAARRIATELAKVRTGEDQPSPSAFREAVRDVIRNCIYGVDKNPLAVELAKVALWLEAHNPGEPLNFLDHHIKCGDAIVGLAHIGELQNGIANEAFKKLPGDDGEVVKAFAKQNKDDKKSKQTGFDFEQEVVQKIDEVTKAYEEFNRLPESTPEEIQAKQEAYHRLSSGANWWRLKTLADIQVAQFFIPKTDENRACLITDNTYKDMLTGRTPLQGSRAIAKATAVAAEKGFFHYFLEFPEIFVAGGFDCILGNPPFLGGQRISGTYGYDYLNTLTTYYHPAKSVDLVTFFFRRIFQIIRECGFQSLIATNTIAQGKSREGGLEAIKKLGGTINYAVRSMRWPGLAAVEVAQVAVHKGDWKNNYVLDGKHVERITSYLDDYEELGNPSKLEQNRNKSFQGSIILGKGFILESQKAQRLIENNPTNKDILFPYLTGRDLNSRHDQTPSRWVINCFDWEIEEVEKYRDVYPIIFDTVKPQRESIITEKEKKNKQLGVHDTRAVKEWWRFLWPRPELYSTIAPFNIILVHARVTKTHAFVRTTNNMVFSDATNVFAFSAFHSFLILQSTIHEIWSWQYSSTMKGDRRYSPSDCFETFPFPQNLSKEREASLDIIGKLYYEYRRNLVLKVQLGLTKTYNQFHNKQLETIDSSLNPKEIETVHGKETLNLWKHLQKTEDTCSFEEAVQDIKHLRELHKEMDNAVLQAYGWQDINLAHDFYEVDYLPENDRIRYTISPEARKEILKRLLKLNHEIYNQEVAQGLHDKKNKAKKNLKSKVVNDEKQGAMF